MEEAFEAERQKGSPPYASLAPLSEPHKQRAAHVLTAAATLERGYQALLGRGHRQGVQSQVHKMDRLHHQWRSDLECFKRALNAQGVEPKALEYTQAQID